jgi:hypothetical protein
MSYRSDVDALAARTQALAAEVATKTKELATAQSLLDEAVAKTKLPVLPNIKVATPCSADWNAMTGDERVRACGACNKNVYNLSSMTRDEAETLIMAKEGRLCVRYYQRNDGTILLKDCAIGIKQKRKRRVLAAGVLALLGGGVFAAIKLSKPTRLHAAAELTPPVAAPDPWAPEVTNESYVEAPPPKPIPPPEHHEIMGGISSEPELHVKMGDFVVDPVPAIEIQ